MPSLEQPDQSTERMLEQYLLNQIEDGDHFFKSRFIADAVPHSPSQIGAAFQKLQHESECLSIEKWAYSGGTTWKVTRA